MSARLCGISPCLLYVKHVQVCAAETEPIHKHGLCDSGDLRQSVPAAKHKRQQANATHLPLLFTLDVT
jgi:hypothetical protein